VLLVMGPEKHVATVPGATGRAAAE
jgi:hypothetical protein